MLERLLAAVVTVACLVPAPVALAQAEAPVATGSRVDAIIEEFGLDERQRERLLTGRTVKLDLPSESEDEVAIAVAVILPITLDEAEGIMDRGDALQIARDVMAYRRVRPEEGAEAFAGFDLSPYESSETAKLIRLDDPRDFNLSSEERAAIEAVAAQHRERGAEVRAPVQQALTDVLRAQIAARFEAYRAGGIRAVAPYARGEGEGEVDVADALLRAARGSSILAERLPRLQRAFAMYPQAQFDAVQHQFYWIKQRVQSRPSVALAHRMILREPEALVLASRLFYVGHGYNARQELVGCLPIEAGIVVFYTSRLFSDVVTGDDSATLQSVGRDLIKQRVAEHFRLLRVEIDKARAAETPPAE